MKKFLKILFYVLTVLYPVLVFSFLVIFKLPVRILSLCVILIAFTLFLSLTGINTSKDKKVAIDWKPLVSSALLLVAGITCFFTNQLVFLKLYSVVISCLFLCIFGSTLFIKPNMIFRFATLADRSIKGSNYEKQVYDYCKRVTIIWCCFFVINGSISAITAFSKEIFGISEELSNTIWSVYNGGISYVLMGLLYGVEFIIRIFVNKKMLKIYPISVLKHYSRKETHVICYNNNDKKDVKRWKDLLNDIACFKKAFIQNSDNEIKIDLSNKYTFLCQYIALIHLGKTPSVVNENGISSTYKACELAEVTKDDVKNLPEINKDNAKINLYGKNTTLTAIEETISSLIDLKGREYHNKGFVKLDDTDLSDNEFNRLMFAFSLGIPFYN